MIKNCRTYSKNLVYRYATHKSNLQSTTTISLILNTSTPFWILCFSYLNLMGFGHYKEANFLSLEKGFSCYWLILCLIAHCLQVQTNKFSQLKEQKQMCAAYGKKKLNSKIKKLERSSQKRAIRTKNINTLPLYAWVDADSLSLRQWNNSSWLNKQKNGRCYIPMIDETDRYGINESIQGAHFLYSYISCSFETLQVSCRYNFSPLSFLHLQ